MFFFSLYFSFIYSSYGCVLVYYYISSQSYYVVYVQIEGIRNEGKEIQRFVCFYFSKLILYSFIVVFF